MKTLIALMLVPVAMASGQSATNVVNPYPPAVFVNGIGDKWYSACDLERIAKDDAKQKKVEFDFEQAGRSLWVYPGTSNIMAHVHFGSGLGKPTYCAFIDRGGSVVTNYVGTAVCGTGLQRMKR